jgi:hypothetical protein
MRQACLFAILIGAGFLHAQDGQHVARPGWPCLAGRAVDPTFIDASESTGGQLFLFQRNEAAQSILVMNASHTHPATVLRAVGNLSGTRDFEFPVDSTIDSLLFLVSVQCRNAILVMRPTGAEITATNSAQNVDLQAGRILRVDQPDTGQWRLRLTGTGLFVVSVLAKTNISLARVTFSTGSVEARLFGQVSGVRMQLVDAGGGPIGDPGETEPSTEGAYRMNFTPQAGRFRVLVTGADSTARPFQRTYPILFQPQPK